MSGDPATTTTPNVLQTRPIAAAGGILVAISAVMAAFWAVVSDAGAMPWLTVASQGLITFAIQAVATTIAALWAQSRSTPTAAPTLVAGTSIKVVDDGGAILGHMDTPTPGDPDA